MRTPEGFTLLHLCTFKNLIKPFNLIISLAT